MSIFFAPADVGTDHRTSIIAAAQTAALRNHSSRRAAANGPRFEPHQIDEAPLQPSSTVAPSGWRPSIYVLWIGTASTISTFETE